MTAVEVEDLVKRFRGPRGILSALAGVSFRLDEGSFTALVGPDGAGKTTLMRLLAGLLRPDSGRIILFGQELGRDAGQLRDRLGYMPQRFGLYERLSVRENLELYAELYGLSGAQRRRRIAEILEITGLSPFPDRLAGRLSGGMKQKLALGAVLLRPRGLLLLDEPSVGVDPLSRRELFALARAHGARGTTVLWSTAYLDEAERCDRVLALDGGELFADAEPAELARSLAGGVHLVDVPERERGAWLERLAADRDVFDVRIRGGRLRIVHRPGRLPAAIEPLRAEPAAPGLEDVIAARLRERQDADPPQSAPGPASVRTSRRNRDEVVIRVRDLVRDFGTFRAVDHLSFEVRRGEVFGLLGPNGAGKSTTFRMLCGVLPPSAGEARVLGHDLLSAAALARARIGYMAQKFSLYGELTVRANLEFTADVYGLAGRRRKARFEAVVEELELAPFLEARAETLPLGFRQRLQMAAALIHEPEILFLDEPTSGVDLLARRAFWRHILQLAAGGTSVLVTTHFLDEAEYCDRVLIMDRGRMLELGPPAEIVSRTRRLEPSIDNLEDAFIALLRDRGRAAA